MKITKQVRRAARRLFRACIVDGLLDDDRARLVVRRIADARRRGSLPLLTHFQRLVTLDRRRHQAIVESATPLTSELRARGESGVMRAYGRGGSRQSGDNPRLMGGVGVKSGATCTTAAYGPRFSRWRSASKSG